MAFKNDLQAVSAITLMVAAQATFAHGALLRDANGSVVGVVEAHSITTTPTVTARSTKGVRFRLNINSGRVEFLPGYYGCPLSESAGRYYTTSDCSGRPYINMSGNVDRCAGQAFKFVVGSGIYFIPWSAVPQTNTLNSYLNVGTGVCSVIPSEISTQLFEYVENDPAITGLVENFAAPLTLEFRDTEQAVFCSGYEACD